MASIINATTTAGVSVQGDNSGSLQLATNNGNTAVTIDTSQNVGIGTSSPINLLQVAKSQTADTAIVVSNPGTANAATTMSFVLAESTTPQGWFRRYRDGTGITEVGYTDILAFSGNVTGTKVERMRIDSSGILYFGTTTANPPPNNVYGVTINASTSSGVYAAGVINASANGSAALSINRGTDDGTLVNFYQAGTVEGSISVSGTTVSYNGGHLARWSQLPNNQKDDTLLKGTVMSNLDEMCVWTKDGEVLPNEQLNKMKVSDVDCDINVAGVFVNWDNEDVSSPIDMNVAMTGDMIIRIAEGVVVQKGDLLMSAGDGTAKPQGDDIRRSKTVAKVTSNHVTCTYADGSYCVPCVLMAC